MLLSKMSGLLQIFCSRIEWDAHTYTQAAMNCVCCVAEGASHALLCLYKGSVLGGLQCGDAWHGGVMLPVKPSETGKGHRQQHTGRVNLCFLTASSLSVLLGVCVECWMEDGAGGGAGGHTSLFLETTWYEISCSHTHMAGHCWRTISEHWASSNPPRLCPIGHRTHTNTQFSATRHTRTDMEHHIWYWF